MSHIKRLLLMLFLISSGVAFGMNSDSLTQKRIKEKNRHLISLCDYNGIFIPPLWKKKVQKLISQGADINCLSEADGFHENDEFTPLSSAARYGQYEKCKILLELGADVNASHPRMTPVAAAIKPGARDRKKMLQLMIDHGADLNIRSQIMGQTPLMLLVAEHNFLNGLRTMHTACQYPTLFDFLKMGADPLIADHDGNNALFHAALAWHDAKDLTLECAPVVLLKFFIWRKYNQTQAFITFLCWARCMKLGANQKQSYIGEALYQKRKRIWAAYKQNFPTLREILALLNNAGKTAHQVFCGYFKQRFENRFTQRPDSFFMELLIPEMAERTERVLWNRIQEEEAQNKARKKR